MRIKDGIIGPIRFTSGSNLIIEYKQFKLKCSIDRTTIGYFVNFDERRNDFILKQIYGGSYKEVVYNMYIATIPCGGIWPFATDLHDLNALLRDMESKGCIITRR